MKTKKGVPLGFVPTTNEARSPWHCAKLPYGKSRTDIWYMPRVASVALPGRRRGSYSPDIGMSPKMQNKENATFLAFLRLSFALK